MAKQKTRATPKSGGLSIARTMVIAGVVIIGTVTASSLYSRQAFIQHRVGGDAYQDIVNGHDLIADYLPPPILPYEAFMMVGESANTTGVNLEKQIARWKELHKQFDDRLAYWDNKMKERPFLDEEKWKAFHGGIQRYGKIFWDNLEKNVIPAFQAKDKVWLETSIASLTAYYRQFVVFTNKNDDFVLETIAHREKESIEASNFSLSLSTVLAVLLGSLLTLILFAGQRFVVRALTQISDVMTALAGGKLDIAVPFENRRDEVGDMARAVTVFKKQAQLNQATREENEYVIRNLGAALETVSRGDISLKINNPFPPALDALRISFNETVDSLQGIISNVRTSADGISSGTAEISLASDDLSRRTENQAANLEQTAAAVSEITTKVRQTATGAAHARNVVVLAKEDADKSGVIVSRAVTAMRQIEETSRKINQIISVMDEMAFQTNLLALNAGVEAARAGDAGRGFAVVASEVRALAYRSAEAAKEIKALLISSQSAVDDGVSLVSETGSSLRSIIQRITELSDIVGEIAESAEHQASGLQEVNTAVEEMDQVTQQNAAMVEETTAATRTLTQQSSDLSSLVGRFKVASKGGAHTESEKAA